MYIKYVFCILIIILLIFMLIRFWVNIFNSEKKTHISDRINHIDKINKLAKKVRASKKKYKNYKSSKDVIDEFMKGEK